jgi:tRNA (guanine37-N1)-methyltransferase
LIIVCGHYEGIDSRIREHFIDQVYSIGDFVLTGGELAAMVIVDATTRLITGVLGNAASLITESFDNGLLEHVAYTRPRDFLGHQVPDILFSGHHQKIEEFRLEDAKRVTEKYRPDLIPKS